jgi:hypothetical protein
MVTLPLQCEHLGRSFTAGSRLTQCGEVFFPNLFGTPKFNPQENYMAVYMVERDLPGITMDQLAAAQKAAIATGQQFTAAGKKVRYIRTTFVPNEAHCMCLFEAESAEMVQEVNTAAKIPFTRIVEALDLTPRT